RMARILITGGSGFIGSNLVEYLSAKGHEVTNFDLKTPRNQGGNSKWIEGDIRNKNQLLKCFQDVDPQYVIHLAARTDLNENANIQGYNSNIEGVSNIVEIVTSRPAIIRTIYASSRMVCRIDYVPTSFDDYCPPNLYGESKMIGEKIVKSKAKGDYVIVRPTSIWGPYFEVPYRTFFDTVKAGMFFIPRGHNPNKSFGYVGNTTFQLEKLLFTQKPLCQQYYLTDYPPLQLKAWADLISTELGGRKITEIPMLPLKIFSKLGDL